MHFRIRHHLRAWLAWARATRQQPSGLEALFTAPSECPIPVPNCGTCRPIPFDPVEVGPAATPAEAILDVVAWLRAEGWQDDAGYLQQYATFLLARRAAYERGGVTAS